MHLINVTSDAADATCRDTVGGAPFLGDGDAVPRCKLCDAQMVLFLQFDIRPEFGLPFRDHSHLLAFMCPKHNEIPSVPSDYDDSPLPDQFWAADEGHYSLQLLPPGQSGRAVAIDTHIAPFQLTFTPSEEAIENYGEFDVGSDAFKVGGVPGWINYAINKRCVCGGNMQFVCQIPDSYGFKQTDTAPEQPDSFSSTEYCLFLGNQVYILACDRQCHANAVIAGCDN